MAGNSVVDPEGVPETCNTYGTLKDGLLGQTRPTVLFPFLTIPVSRKIWNIKVAI